MPATQEPPLAPEVAQAKGLRTGWTTGTCASAAAKAAATWLVGGEPPATVEVALPSGRRVSFAVTDVDRRRLHRCAVVKDAGDDPDVTNGAHLTAEVTWLAAQGGTPDAIPAVAIPGRAATGPGQDATSSTSTPGQGPADPATAPARTTDRPSTRDEAHPTDKNTPQAVATDPAATRGERHLAGTVPTPAPGDDRTTGQPDLADTDTDTGPAPPAADLAAIRGGPPEATGGSAPTAPPADVEGRATVTVDGVTLAAGEGVGTVTLPGLGLDVGGPAINPVPRRMITAAVREVTDRPVLVTISVPGGEAMAAKTSNDRLGIVGGISILGTTGIVKPFSTASYRASVVQQVDVAAAQGQRHMALSTGSRSDRAAQRLLPDLAPVCFVEVGDFSGIALRRAAGAGVERITWVGMAGKIAKLAAGVLMTHYRRSKVDGELLAEVARAARAPAAVVEAATATATARHFAEVCLDHGSLEPLAELCRRAARACAAHVDGALAVEVIMVDFAGEEVLARG